MNRPRHPLLACLLMGVMAASGPLAPLACPLHGSEAVGALLACMGLGETAHDDASPGHCHGGPTDHPATEPVCQCHDQPSAARLSAERPIEPGFAAVAPLSLSADLTVSDADDPRVLAAARPPMTPLIDASARQRARIQVFLL